MFIANGQRNLGPVRELPFAWLEGEYDPSDLLERCAILFSASTAFPVLCKVEHIMKRRRQPNVSNTLTLKHTCHLCLARKRRIFSLLRVFVTRPEDEAIHG